MESYYSWFLFLVCIAAGLKYYQMEMNKKEDALSTASNDREREPLSGTDADNDQDAANTAQRNKAFKAFQKSYVLIFLMAMLADWMQGPYVYKLYSGYELEQSAIASLFVIGFGTSGIFGIFIGGLADKFGRKLTCMIFCIAYALGCVTKHFHIYNVLLIGRFLGGISTSILFSAFESWMVTHHNNNNFAMSKLGDTFSLAWSLNSVIAVLAGVITSYAVSFYKTNGIVNGPPNSPYEVAAFDCSAIALMITLLLIVSLWKENYGDSRIDVIPSIKKSFNMLINDKRIIYTGLIQTGFESAMYIFVFMWTPALESSHFTGDIDHGMIFADFMVGCLIGTLLSSLIGKLFHWQCEKISLLLTVIACLSMLIIPNTESYELRLFSFLIFELCVGMYFPTIGSLRGKYIPDEVRATLMNIFRAPFNIIVVIILLYVSNLGLYSTFLICSMLLAFSVFGTWLLMNTLATMHDTKTGNNNTSLH